MPVSSPAVPGQRTCHALGTYATVVTTDPAAVNRLMDAGAAMRSLGRVRWLEVDTLEPWPNPGASMLFILDSTDSAK